jgi:hypothetical protein
MNMCSVSDMMIGTLKHNEFFILKPGFDTSSYQFLASASKRHWPTVTCWPGALPVVCESLVTPPLDIPVCTLTA